MSSTIKPFTFSDSVTNEFFEYFAKEIKLQPFKGAKLAGLCVPTLLISLVETVARGVFAIISLPAFAASAAIKKMGCDKAGIGVKLFANNFKALGVTALNTIKSLTGMVGFLFIPDKTFHNKQGTFEQLFTITTIRPFEIEPDSAGVVPSSEGTPGEPGVITN